MTRTVVLSVDEMQRGLRTVATWQEIHGAPGRSDLDALRLQIAEFDALGLVEVASRFSAILSHPAFRDKAPVELYRPLPSPALRAAMAAAVGRGVAADEVVHRQQVLTLMKLALTSGRVGAGRQIETQADEHELGEILLRLNDHLLPDFNDALRGEEHRRSVLAILVLHSILGHSTHVPGAVARCLRMLEIHDALAGHPEWFDVRGEFQRAAGLAIDAYIHHVFAAWAFVAAWTPAVVEGDPRAIVNHPETVVRNTGVSAEEFKAALRQISRVPEEFRARLLAQPARAAYVDFVEFQDRPLIEFPPGFFWPIDPGFLLDKLGEGVFWLLHRPDRVGDPDAQRNLRLRQWWGRLFEEYADLLMRTFYEGSNRYARVPQVAGGGARCDAVLDSGPDLILFEYKASYLQTNAKLSGDSELLLQDVRRKFAAGGGQGEHAKGVRQLASACAELQQTGQIAGVGAFERVARLYPVLVALDAALASREMNWYLDALFRAALVEVGGDPGRVAPLTVMVIEDLERALPYTAERSLVDMLRLFHDEDPDLHTSFRFVMSTRVHRNPGLRNAWIEERADAWKDELLRRYFPNRGG